MHLCFSGAAAMTVLASLVAGAIHAEPAAAVARRRSRELATEVCEDMVRDAAVAAAGEALASPQQGGWSASRYRCRYSFRDGALLVDVDVFRTDKLAQKRFAANRKRAGISDRLPGIGQQAFKSHAGAIVARKDRFVLTVDPTGLPNRLNVDAIVFWTARAVFDCW